MQGWVLRAVLLLAVLGMPSVVQAQTPTTCTWPDYAVFHATNPNGDYVAWADGAAIYWLHCADGVTIQMFVEPTPTGLYFDGPWLSYILHYLLTDGSHWQISVVAPHHPTMISPPYDPAVTDTPGEAQGGQVTVSSPPPTAIPAAVRESTAVERQPYPLFFRVRLIGWF